MLCVTGMYVKDVTLHNFYYYAFECELSEHLLFLFVCWGGEGGFLSLSLTGYVLEDFSESGEKTWNLCLLRVSFEFVLE